MKKLIFVILLSAMLSIMFVGCIEPNYKYTINVSGTSGLPFSGSYIVVSTNGTSTLKDVDATVPASYTVTGNIVTVNFQKNVTSGTLKVEILKGSDVVSTSETTAEYGVVKLANNAN